MRPESLLIKSPLASARECVWRVHPFPIACVYDRCPQAQGIGEAARPEFAGRPHSRDVIDCSPACDF